MPETPSRRDLVADTALALVAEEGLRGLTHRAVDAAAGLPAGATSNVARTRAALLELALHRIVEVELAEAAGPAGGEPVLPDTPDALARMLAELIHHQTRDPAARARLRARLELALEANRRPELRTAYDALGTGLRDRIAAALAALGSPEPERHARSLTAWLEGQLFYSAAGAAAAQPPSRTELRTGLSELLAGMAGSRVRPTPPAPSEA